MQRILSVSLVCAALLGVQGCSSISGNDRGIISTSISNMLAPVADSSFVADKKPLRLPANVAIIMAPGAGYSIPTTELAKAGDSLRTELMGPNNRKYINQATVVTQGDVSAKISLPTIARLYGADIVLLVTYTQDQTFGQRGFAQALDAAIIPSFTVPSVRLTTSSRVEGVVIHTPSNAIIFRTNGTDSRQLRLTRATAEGGYKTGTESTESLQAAAKNMGLEISKTLNSMQNFENAPLAGVALDEYLKTQKSAGGLTSEGVVLAKSTASNWDKVGTYKSSGGGGGAMSLLDLSALAALSLAAYGVRMRLGKKEVA